MLDERFARTRFFGSDIPKKIGMAVLRIEVRRFEVAKWAIGARNFVGYRGTNRDLDALDRVQDEQAKLAIKNVEARYVIELGTGNEGITLLERQEIRA